MTLNDFLPIKHHLDKHFAFWKEQGKYAFSHMTEFIPTSMLDPAQEPDDEGYSFWLPIPSAVDDRELHELESIWRHPVPPSFAYFLQQRYFLGLQLGSNVRPFDNLPQKLAVTFEKVIATYYAQLLARNYLPFANFGDWGVLCFDANAPLENEEYPIVIFDHEDDYTKVEFFAINFLALMRALEQELDTAIKEINAAKGY